MADNDASRKTKVFISYSRKNKLFVSKLNKAIVESGIESWVDWEGIPLSADWMAEINAAIEASDAFVFVISPDSIKSKVCMDELELCIKYKKKVVPVLYSEPEEKQKVHPKLASTNWVYMRAKKDDFQTAMPQLIETFQTDLDWVRQHTRLLQRASEWEQKNRNTSYLLQGSDLNEGEQWMIEATKNTTRSIVPVQAEYINTSRKEAIKRQRNLTIGVGVAMAVSLLLGLLSIFGWNTANNNALRANRNAELAKNSAELAKNSAATASASEALAKENEATALRNEAIAMSQSSAIQAGMYEIRPGGLFTSALLAIESWQRYPSSDAENILRLDVSRMAVPVAQVKQNGRISNITMSADGKYIVAASDDGTACLWTLKGEKKYCVQQNGTLNDAILSQDNSRLVTAGTDGFVNLWDGKNGTPLKSLEFKSNVWDIDISRDNKWLAAGSQDGRITLVDFVKMKEEVSFSMGSKEIYALTFSSTSEWLAFGLSSGQVTLWRVNSGTSQSGPKHTAGAHKIEFSPDGNWLVSIGPDKTARVAKTNEGGTKYILNHNDWVEDVAFSPDGSWFATAADDKLVRVFETETGYEKFRMEHAGYVSKVEVSPNGQWIASTGFDGRALVWDATSGTLVREIPLDSPGTAIAFSADNSLLIVGDESGQISLWDISNLNARIGYIEFPDVIHKAKFNHTGEWALFNTDDQNLWIIPTDQFTTLHDGSQGKKILEVGAITNQTKVSPDSKWIAFTENYGHTANLYNIETSTLHTMPHETDVTGIGFNKDGTLLATARDKGTSIYIWNVESGKQVKEIKLDETAFTISFSPLDTTLVIGMRGKFIIWDVASNKEIASYKQVGDIKSVNFSRDGHWLATTSSAGGISIWDMKKELLIEPTYTFVQGGSITSLDFSPDGKLLASGSSNGYAYLWDLEVGEERARLPHNSSVSGVSFSPTDDILLTVSQKVTQVWDLSQLEFISTEKIVEIACGKLQKNFSESEWEFFFPNEDFRLLCPNLPAG